MQITVVIPTYNSETIKECLEAVFACEGDFEVIVADDHSTDNTLLTLKELQKKYKRLKIVENEEKKGPGGNRNTAIKHAKDGVLIFLDDDVIVMTKDFVKIHSELAQKYDVVVGRTVPSKENYIPNVMKVGNENRGSFFTWNNGSMLRKIAIENPFNDELYIGTEDSELRNRLQKKGYIRFYAENALARHVINETILSMFRIGWRRGTRTVNVPLWKSICVLCGYVAIASAKYTYNARRSLKGLQIPEFYIVHMIGLWIFNLGNIVGMIKRKFS